MQISGFIALFAAIIGSKIINERAFRALADDEKLRLMDGFSKTRAYALIPLFVIIGLYFLLITQTNLDKGLMLISYFSLLLVFVVIRTAMNHKKLVNLQMPIAYRRLFALSQVLSLVGMAWFFYTFFSTKLGT